MAGGAKRINGIPYQSEACLSENLPGPTPLENWSRTVRREVRASRRVLQPSPNGGLERTQQQSDPQIGPNAIPPALDDLALAHKAIFGCLPDQAARLYWQQAGDKKTDFPSLITKFLDASHRDPAEVWDRIGLSQVIHLEPTKWPELGPLPFLVATYWFLTKKFPKISEIDKLLKDMIGKSIAIKDAAVLVANSVDVDSEKVEALLKHYASHKNRRFFLRTNTTTNLEFSDKDVFQAIVQLKIIRSLSQNDWGVQPYHAMFRMIQMIS